MVAVLIPFQSARAVPVIRHDTPHIALTACDVVAGGGPSFLKILKSVFSKVSLISTGEAAPENSQTFLNASALYVDDADGARNPNKAALAAVFSQSSKN